LEQKYPNVVLSNNFGTEGASRDANGFITGFREACHADKHWCQSIRDVYNHCINALNSSKPSTHSFYATAEAACIAREVSLQAAAAEMAANLAIANATGQEPPAIVGFIGRGDYTPAQLAIMERDGFGQVVRIQEGRSDSGQKVGQVTAHSGIDTHKFVFVADIDPVTGQFFYREVTSYPDVEGDKDQRDAQWQGTEVTAFSAVTIKA
jgi:hypothetical protein